MFMPWLDEEWRVVQKSDWTEGYDLMVMNQENLARPVCFRL
jgi:hypothetical protein